MTVVYLSFFGGGTMSLLIMVWAELGLWFFMAQSCRSAYFDSHVSRWPFT